MTLDRGPNHRSQPISLPLCFSDSSRSEASVTQETKAEMTQKHQMKPNYYSIYRYINILSLTARHKTLYFIVTRISLHSSNIRLHKQGEKKKAFLADK